VSSASPTTPTEKPHKKRKHHESDAVSFTKDDASSSSSSSSSSVSSRRASGRSGAGSQSSRRAGSGRGAPAGPPEVPIIVVPNSVTALINMYNVRDFLIEGKFVESMEKKRAGARKAAVITVERMMPKGEMQRFEIIENPATLTKAEDWRRIVAVFAQGPTWQFKGWKWNKPVQIFTYARGFHVNYDDAIIPDNINQWNIKTLRVNRTMRHQDSTVAFEFWKDLEHFLAHRQTPPLK